MTDANSSNEDRSTLPESGTPETVSDSVVTGTSAENGTRRYRHDALDVTYEEARRVVEHQLDSVNDIDSKAAHTLRVLFVLFGLLITTSSLLVNTLLRRPATSLATAKRFVNAFTTAGVVFLLFSLLVAIWTYNETHAKSGLSPSEIRSLSRDTPRERRFRQLFSQFPKWVVHNEIVIRKDSTLLFVSHFTMFFGLISLITGVVSELPLDFGTYVVRTSFPPSYWLLALGTFTFGLGVFGSLSTHSRRVFVKYADYIGRTTLLRFCGLILFFAGLALVILG